MQFRVESIFCNLFYLMFVKFLLNASLFNEATILFNDSALVKEKLKQYNANVDMCNMKSSYIFVNKCKLKISFIYINIYEYINMYTFIYTWYNVCK